MRLRRLVITNVLEKGLIDCECTAAVLPNGNESRLRIFRGRRDHGEGGFHNAEVSSDIFSFPAHVDEHRRSLRESKGKQLGGNSAAQRIKLRVRKNPCALAVHEGCFLWNSIDSFFKIFE